MTSESYWIKISDDIIEVNNLEIVDGEGVKYKRVFDESLKPPFNEYTILGEMYGNSQDNFRVLFKASGNDSYKVLVDMQKTAYPSSPRPENNFLRDIGYPGNERETEEVLTCSGIYSEWTFTFIQASIYDLGAYYRYDDKVEQTVVCGDYVKVN